MVEIVKGGMNLKTIKVMTKKVGQKPNIETTSYELENLQKLVGGNLEAVTLPYRITMWIDEEGILKEKPVNLITYVEGKEVHQIVGDVFFAGYTPEGDTISLTDEQCKWLENALKFMGVTNNNEGNPYPVYGLLVE
jgi:Domain of unknown function (DUF3846)